MTLLTRAGWLSRRTGLQRPQLGRRRWLEPRPMDALSRSMDLAELRLATAELARMVGLHCATEPPTRRSACCGARAAGRPRRGRVDARPSGEAPLRRPGRLASGVGHRGLELASELSRLELAYEILRLAFQRLEPR